MTQRITYRRKHSYNTRSNRVKPIRTPGGKLVFQYTKKKASGPHCGDCGAEIAGIPHLRPKQMSRIPKRKRTISRAHGVRCCGRCVRDRITRAFLIEEQKIVKSILKAKLKKSNNA